MNENADETIRLLVDHGVEVNFENHSGQTPLFLAFSSAKEVASDTLIGLGAERDENLASFENEVLSYLMGLGGTSRSG